MAYDPLFHRSQEEADRDNAKRLRAHLGDRLWDAYRGTTSDRIHPKREQSRFFDKQQWRGNLLCSGSLKAFLAELNRVLVAQWHRRNKPGTYRGDDVGILLYAYLHESDIIDIALGQRNILGVDGLPELVRYQWLILELTGNSSPKLGLPSKVVHIAQCRARYSLPTWLYFEGDCRSWYSGMNGEFVSEVEGWTKLHFGTNRQTDTTTRTSAASAANQRANDALRKAWM